MNSNPSPKKHVFVTKLRDRGGQRGVFRCRASFLLKKNCLKRFCPLFQEYTFFSLPASVSWSSLNSFITEFLVFITSSISCLADWSSTVTCFKAAFVWLKHSSVSCVSLKDEVKFKGFDFVLDTSYRADLIDPLTLSQ